MRQRNSVRVVIEDSDGHILLLRRSLKSGRQSTRGKYELLGGRVRSNEQPEDTLRRLLKQEIGMSFVKAVVDDVVTYIDDDFDDIQYLVVIYRIKLQGKKTIKKFGEKYDKFEWIERRNLQHFDLTQLTSLIIGIISQEVITERLDRGYVIVDDKNTSNYDSTIFSDGGSRGNPGHSAAGFVIVNRQQEIVEQGGEYLGITTNSQAEYHGVRLGLERALALGLKRIDFRIDNMMVVNHMNGVYRVKNRELWPIHERIKKLASQFELVHFSHIKREFNRLADSEVNKMLDEYSERKRNAL